jgi:hypothetical protein
MRKDAAVSSEFIPQIPPNPPLLKGGESLFCPFAQGGKSLLITFVKGGKFLSNPPSPPFSKGGKRFLSLLKGGRNSPLGKRFLYLLKGRGNSPLWKRSLSLLKGDFFILPLFGKEGLGEIFIALCDGPRHECFLISEILLCCYFPVNSSPLTVFFTGR